MKEKSASLTCAQRLVQRHAPSSPSAASGNPAWAGVDSAWEQRKLKAEKMFKNAADRASEPRPEQAHLRLSSHPSGAHFVRRRHVDAAPPFLRSPLPYTVIMTVELDQVPFGIEKVKHPAVQPTRFI